jgi:hypothetical protein
VTEPPGFNDLVGRTPAQLTELLRASVISGAASTAAAVEMLATSYDGRFLNATPIREAIGAHDGCVTVNWLRLAELAHLMTVHDPDAVDEPDLLAIYRAGLPANSRHILAAIAALGNGEIGVREAEILATAYPHVALSSNDWTFVHVEPARQPLSFSYTLTLHSGLADRLEAAAASRGAQPLDVIREALEQWLTGLEKASPPTPPPGRAQLDGGNGGEEG